MPFKYKIIHEKEAILVQAFGTVDLQSSVDNINEVVTHDEFNSTYKVIIDFRETGFNPSMMEMFTLRDSMASLKHKIDNEITVISKKSYVPVFSMIGFLSKVYNIKLKATDHYDGIDELESYL